VLSSSRRSNPSSEGNSGCSTVRTASSPTWGSAWATSTLLRRSPTRTVAAPSNHSGPARHHLPDDLDLEEYCRQLIERFENSRIGYQLEQIASDSVMKLRTRIAPVIVAEGHADATAPPCRGRGRVGQLDPRTRFVPGRRDRGGDRTTGRGLLGRGRIDSPRRPQLVDVGAFVDQVQQLVLERTDIGGPLESSPHTTGEH